MGDCGRMGYTLGCVKAMIHEAFLLGDNSRTTSVFLFFSKNVFYWLSQVLVAAHRIINDHCSIQEL